MAHLKHSAASSEPLPTVSILNGNSPIGMEDTTDSIPTQALALVEPEPEPAETPVPTEPANPSSEEVPTQPLATLPAQDNTLATQSPEIPLYLRNPGPPPKLPGKANVTNLGRTSYHYHEAGSTINYRPVLWVCAGIGLFILFLLLVLKIPTLNLFSNPVVTGPGDTTLKAEEAPLTTRVVNPDEQFALVTVEEARIYDEPGRDSSQVQSLQKNTFIALQKYSSNDWYQLKGGSGWVAAEDIHLYPTEQAAWDAKHQLEATP